MPDNFHRLKMTKVPGLCTNRDSCMIGSSIHIYRSLFIANSAFSQSLGRSKTSDLKEAARVSPQIQNSQFPLDDESLRPAPSLAFCGHKISNMREQREPKNELRSEWMSEWMNEGGKEGRKEGRNERTNEWMNEWSTKMFENKHLKSRKDGTGTKFVLSSTLHTGATF